MDQPRHVDSEALPRAGREIAFPLEESGVEDEPSTGIPGFMGAFVILLFGGAAMATNQLVRCVSEPLGSLQRCLQGEAQGATILGGLALLLAVSTSFAALRTRQTERPATATAGDSLGWQGGDERLVAFAEAWADQIESIERSVAAVDAKDVDVDSLLAEGARIRTYNQMRREIGLTAPTDVTAASKGDTNKTRLFIALALFAWAAWVLAGPIGCLGERGARCRDAAIGDLWLGALGIIAAGLFLLVREPSVWKGRCESPVPPEHVDAPTWIADRWLRLVAEGREPAGPAALSRGAAVARALAEYVPLARAAGVAAEPTDVAAVFGKVVTSTAPIGSTAIRPQSELPYPRGVIKEALYVMIALTRNDHRRESAKSVLMLLEDYLPDAELTPYRAQLEKARAQEALIDEIGERHRAGEKIGPDVLDDLRKLSGDREALRPLVERVEEAKARTIAEVEARLGHLFPGRSAFPVWFMTRTSHSRERAESPEQALASGVPHGYFEGRASAPSADALFAELAELERHLADVRRCDVRDKDREDLGLYRIPLEAVVDAAREMRSALVWREAAAYDEAQDRLRAAIERLQRVNGEYVKRFAPTFASE